MKINQIGLIIIIVIVSVTMMGLTAMVLSSDGATLSIILGKDKSSLTVKGQ